MKTLSEQEVLQIFREEWQKKIDALTEEVGFVIKEDKTNKKKSKHGLISPELKVLHKKSRLLYTVSSISIRDVVLRTPEGEEFLINKNDFEREYELA